MSRLATLDFPADDEAVSTTNKNYLCRITANDLGSQERARTGSGSTPTILLNLPEQFQFSVASAYETPFAQGLIDNETIKNFGRVMGVTNFVTQGLTAQVWQGTSETSFSMTFELVAKDDPDKDVVQPIKRLMLLTMPDENAVGLLTPPGPTIDFGSTAEQFSFSALRQALKDKNPPKVIYKNTISLEIGRFMRFPSVVVENVAVNGKSLFHRTGLPIVATVDISFKTFVVPVKKDLDGMFPYSAATRISSKGTS